MFDVLLHCTKLKAKQAMALWMEEIGNSEEIFDDRFYVQSKWTFKEIRSQSIEFFLEF